MLRSRNSPKVSSSCDSTEGNRSAPRNAAVGKNTSNGNSAVGDESHTTQIVNYLQVGCDT